MNRLRICAWIETSSAAHRLIADQELGLHGQRARDADALALAAGELMRIAAFVGGIEAGAAQLRIDIGVEFAPG